LAIIKFRVYRSQFAKRNRYKTKNRFYFEENMVRKENARKLT